MPAASRDRAVKADVGLALDDVVVGRALGVLERARERRDRLGVGVLGGEPGERHLEQQRAPRSARRPRSTRVASIPAIASLTVCARPPSGLRATNTPPPGPRAARSEVGAHEQAHRLADRRAADAQLAARAPPRCRRGRPGAARARRSPAGAAATRGRSTGATPMRASIKIDLLGRVRPPDRRDGSLPNDSGRRHKDRAFAFS